MKLETLLNVSAPLDRLLEKNFTNFTIIRKLGRLKEFITKEIRFYMDEETKLINKYAAKDDKGNFIFLDGGRIQLKTAEDRNAFEEEIGKLRETEIDDFPVVELNDSDFKTMDDLPTPADFIILDKIIKFEE